MKDKNRLFAFVAFGLGFIGLSMILSDLSQGESWWIRIVTATLFFFLTGAAIGFFNSTFWMISALTAWGGVLIGGWITFAALVRHGTEVFNADPPYLVGGLLILFVPIALSLTGGYVGNRISQARSRLK
jgi:hypothetical protein